jgi:hypothetical protein
VATVPSYLASRPSIETLADLAVRVRIPIASWDRAMSGRFRRDRAPRYIVRDPAASQRD